MSTAPTSQRPLLFDSHAHLVADDQQTYPRNPMTRAANAPYRAPGVIGKPGGKHGPNPVNEVPDASRVLRWMQEENVDGIVAVQKRMIYRYDNSYILDSSDRYPDLFSAVVILDAQDAATPDLVRRFVRDHALVGVRLFGGREPDGSMPWLNSAQALKTWEVAQEHALVMDLEVPNSRRTSARYRRWAWSCCQASGSSRRDWPLPRCRWNAGCTRRCAWDGSTRCTSARWSRFTCPMTCMTASTSTA